MTNVQSQKGRTLSIVQLRVPAELVLPGEDGTYETLFSDTPCARARVLILGSSEWRLPNKNKARIYRIKRLSHMWKMMEHWQAWYFHLCYSVPVRLDAEKTWQPKWIIKGTASRCVLKLLLEIFASAASTPRPAHIRKTISGWLKPYCWLPIHPTAPYPAVDGARWKERITKRQWKANTYTKCQWVKEARELLCAKWKCAKFRNSKTAETKISSLNSCGSWLVSFCTTAHWQRHAQLNKNFMWESSGGLTLRDPGLNWSWELDGVDISSQSFQKTSNKKVLN